MKHPIQATAILTPALILSVFGTSQTVEAQKPLNIIHIMTDDHSYQTISAYGHALGKLAPT
ncbi:MAG: sulfatase, partial [Parabacteroides sp.]